VIHGDLDRASPHVLNLSFPGLDGDEVIELLEGVAAVSTGSACTSVCATSSHVLAAMHVAQPHLDGAVRLSWSHMTEESNLDGQLASIVDRLTRAGSRHG